MIKSNITLSHIKEKTNPIESSFVSYYLYRPMSRRITFLLARTSITPEQIHIFALLIGIIGSIFFLYHNYLSILLGTLIFFFRQVLDCVDGEIARLKDSCSESGALYDVFVDRVVDVMMFFSLGLGLWWAYHQTIIWVYAFFAIEGNFIMGIMHLKIQLLNTKLDIKKNPIKNKKLLRKLSQYGDDAGMVILVLFAIFNKIIYGLFITAMLSNLFTLVLFFYNYNRLRKLEK